MSVEFGEKEEQIILRVNEINKYLKNLIIGSDIDGCDVHSQKLGIQIVNNNLGTNFGVQDLRRDFAIVDLISAARPGIADPKQYAIDIWNGRQVISQSPIVPGASLVSNFLINEGITPIKRITSRPSSNRRWTLDWYKRNMPLVELDDIYIQDRDEIGLGFKIRMINELGIQLFIEDTYEHAFRIISGTDARVLMIPQPWNEDFVIPDTDRIIRPPKNFMVGQPAYVRAYFYLAKII